MAAAETQGKAVTVSNIVSLRGNRVEAQDGVDSVLWTERDSATLAELGDHLAKKLKGSKPKLNNRHDPSPRTGHVRGLT